MSEPAENLPERVTDLERRVADVHDLASKTDREVAEWRRTLKNHTKVLNAWGDHIDERFNKVDERFNKVDERFNKVETEMREGFSMLKDGQVQITMLLNDEIKRRKDTDGPSDEADG